MLGILFLIVIFIAQPFGLREQFQALGLEIEAAREITLPHMFRRFKSIESGIYFRSSLVQTVAMIGLYALLITLYPGLWQDQTLFVLFVVGAANCLFATANLLNGHMRRELGQVMTDAAGNQILIDGIPERHPDRWLHPYALHPTLCRPSWWLVYTMIVWLVLGVYIIHLGLSVVDDRLALALGASATCMAWIPIKVFSVLASWSADKGIGLGEWALTTFADVLPANIRSRIPVGGVDVLNQQRIKAFLDQYPNLLVIMWLPWFFATIWSMNGLVSVAFAATTALAAVSSLAYTVLGEGEKVKENTKKVVGWIWAYGKYVSLFVCGLGVFFQFSEGARMTWDEYGNKMAGITPFVTLGMAWWKYVLIAIGCLVAAKYIWKGEKKMTGKLAYLVKLPVLACLIVAAICLIAPFSILGGHREWRLGKSYPDTIGTPVGLETPSAEFRPVDGTGKQELVITVYTHEKGAKGVVEFPQATARALRINKYAPSDVDPYLNDKGEWVGGLKKFSEKVQIPLRRATKPESCGTDCVHWRYEARVTSLTGGESGRYSVLMRNAPLGQVEEKLDQSFGGKISSTP